MARANSHQMAPRVAAILLCTASQLIPQDLPPEVLMLARFKQHQREELGRLPNYTCLATVARFHKEPPPSARARNPLRPMDTVVLEVVYTNGREWYGLPGEKNLHDEDPARFIGSGMIGSGAFAITLSNILEGAFFTYEGEQPLEGRPAVKYDFRFPRLGKGFSISMPEGSGTVGEKGSLWLDPHSLDILRLAASADEIPPYLPLAAASTRVAYARTRIGDATPLLAQQADLEMTANSGTGDFDHFEFSHCRAFTAQSTVRFGAAAEDTPASAQPPGPAPGGEHNLPALLMVTVRLDTRITGANAVGSLIEGRTVGEVLRKGKVAIADNAVVRGRIRRLERYFGPGKPQYIVGLEFTEIDSPDGPVPFYADLLRLSREPGIRASLTEPVLVRAHGVVQAAGETITLPELPGVASFFVSGDTFSLPAGLRTVWRTRGPIR